jgi:hypothetical protein
MELEERFRRNRQILWGLFLVAVGVAFLLDRAGLVDLPGLRHFWPMVFVVLAASRALARRPGAAAMFALMALAFFAAEFRWFGLGYHTFWPLLLVAVGAGIVIRVLSGEDARCARGEAYHE